MTTGTRESSSQWPGSPRTGAAAVSPVPSPPPPAAAARESTRGFGRSKASFRSASQKFHVEAAPRKQHFVESSLDVFNLHSTPLIGLEKILRTSTHQFLDEGSTCFLCLADDEVDDIIWHFQTVRVKLDQLSSPFLIRQRKLNRLINAARARRECDLKLLRPVRCQD